jgi:hypothetical protein
VRSVTDLAHFVPGFNVEHALGLYMCDTRDRASRAATKLQTGDFRAKTQRLAPND